MASSSSTFNTYSKLVGFGRSFEKLEFIWAETISPANNKKLRNAKAPFFLYLVTNGNSKKKINVVKRVEATIILSPNPTGNICTKGANMNNAGIPRKTNKNGFGFF
eukprot:TRINITY_DN830_c0_g1_i4.p2 TRINITY_DN830_c0_g1~~TRINITY_DN830_c0_g1_i4.p2  ORF type:complete len:106 (+),score=8.24 TRINITY_DN830_c0_g1_i4:1998-2315(+)